MVFGKKNNSSTVGGTCIVGRELGVFGKYDGEGEIFQFMVSGEVRC